MSDDVTTRFAREQKRGGRRRFLSYLYLSAAWMVALLVANAALPAFASSQLLRMAFSSSMFSEANESDARAAMKAWIMTVAKERRIPVDTDSYIYRTADELVKAGRTLQVDGFGVITPEYARLSQEMKFDRIALGVKDGRITEEYLLLVRKDSGLERLDQLTGRSLNVLLNPRMSLAVIWLDTVLMEARLNRTSDFFGPVTVNKKASQVALPVFFGKVDACLLTQMSFKVMAELNPQLKEQMRVLANSPALVPSGFAFRADYASPSRGQILEAMERLGDSPAGRQILALTQSDRIENHPVACLDGSLDLLAKHRRLCAETNTGPAGKAPVKTIKGAK